MDYKTVLLDRTVSFSILAAIVTVIASFIGYQLWIGAKTMPSPIEGFAGPAKGAGYPDCLRTSSEAAALFELVSRRPQTVEEGSDDLRELQVLLGKLACFKRDILSPSGIVEATRKQPFRTSHDMEPVAETAARCFAKTLPKRDLELSLEKWNSRGILLVKRICTSENFSNGDAAKALNLFKLVMADVKDVSFQVCFKGPVMIAGQEGPRMIPGVEPAGLSQHSEYKGYY